MAHPHLKETLASFSVRVQNQKNRLIAIPTEVQRKLGLRKQRDNHLIFVSIRRSGARRWNHHYFKLTQDNEFAIPADIAHVKPKDIVDVRVRRIIPDMSVSDSKTGRQTAAGLLLRLNEQPRKGWRSDGTERLDEYLNEDVRGNRPVR